MAGSRQPKTSPWSSPTNQHTLFFTDPSKEIGVVVTKRKLPVDASMKVYAGVEAAVYRNLK
jgi:hypothetical protein